MPRSLDDSEKARFARHLSLPEIGEEGQLRLREASVLLVGLGGLGSPAALYLAATGVGQLVLVDDDAVEESNLQRQLLFGVPDLGRTKVEAATERLRLVQPELEIEAVAERFTAENALALASACDVIVDGSDNFPTRYLSSDVAVWTGKPNAFGAVDRFEGQATVLHPSAGGPCYRCLFPKPPDPGTVPT